MKDIFTKGDTKVHTKRVEQEDVAAFNGAMVHPVCSTFALAREVEWSSRLFVLEMKSEDEEGIGTMLTINHKAPALLDDELHIEAVVASISGNELICDYTVHVGGRLVATGQTGQKILKKEKVAKLFEGLK